MTSAPCRSPADSPASCSEDMLASASPEKIFWNQSSSACITSSFAIFGASLNLDPATVAGHGLILRASSYPKHRDNPHGFLMPIGEHRGSTWASVAAVVAVTLP